MLNKCTLCFLLLLGLSPAIAAQEEDDDNSWLYKTNPASLAVIDSYLEMHTGPGRGYPVFYVIEQGDQIEVLTRRPDWYEVRSSNNKIGWVKASQLGRTLQTSGEPADLPSVSYGDYAANRWRVGMNAGMLSGDELSNAETFSANLGYFPWSYLGAELEASKFYGDEARATQTGINLVFEPFPLFAAVKHYPLSPALVLGTGNTHFSVQPRQITGELEDSKHNVVGLRLNYYLGRNFIMRGEYRKTSLDTDDTLEFDIWQLGFTTFF